MKSSLSGAKSKFSPWLKNPICVALDVDDQQQALRLAEQLAPHCGGLKLGPRLVLKYGAEFVRKISALSPTFVDCKFFDIPSTTVASVRACFDMGATLVTVHASVGPTTLKQLAHLEAELSQIRPFKILCVTILTSWSEKERPSIIQPQPIAQLVKSLSQEVHGASLSGLVCSANELSQLKDSGLWCLVPGIRRAKDAAGDQSRIDTPDEALKKGASALVVGRPIIQAANPVSELKDFLEITQSAGL